MLNFVFRQSHVSNNIPPRCSLQEIYGTAHRSPYFVASLPHGCVFQDTGKAHVALSFRPDGRAIKGGTSRIREVAFAEVQRRLFEWFEEHEEESHLKASTKKKKL